MGLLQVNVVSVHHCNTSLFTPPASRPADGRRLPQAPLVIAPSSRAITTDSACRVFAQRLPEPMPSVSTPIWTSFNVSNIHNCQDKDLTVNSGNSRVPEQEASLLPLLEGYFGLAVVVMSWDNQDWAGALTPVESQSRASHVYWTGLLIGECIQGKVNWQIC